jgi:ABC-type amino acid transport substrate-binding protein
VLAILGTLALLAPALAAIPTAAAPSDASTAPAGAESTKITDWTDPRPAKWADSFPLFAPVPTGDGSLLNAQQNGLNVCAQLDTRPWGYTDPATGQKQGVEIAMENYVANLLGISQVNHIDIPWASGLPAVQAGQCDIFANALAIRSDRAKAPGILYTTPYMLIFDVITVRKDSGINGVPDLQGKTIASAAGSTDSLTAKSLIARELGGEDTTKLVNFNDANACFQATANGTTDACFLDQGVAQGALGVYSNLVSVPNVAITYVPLNPEEPTQNPYVFGSVGAVMKPSLGDLNLALSIALNQWVSSGMQQQELEKVGMWAPAQANLVRPETQ